MLRTILTLAICFQLAATLNAQDEQARSRNYPPKMADAKPEVYKTIGDVELKIYRFEPADHKASDKRPAIVFFFGGGLSFFGGVLSFFVVGVESFFGGVSSVGLGSGSLSLTRLGSSVSRIVSRAARRVNARCEIIACEAASAIASSMVF